MPTLLLRLAGPMQSWGTQSRFGHRDTGLEPSKSGVIGLLCCALGWQREESDFKFASGTLTLEAFSRGLKMAVRVDREGRMSRDFHTAQEVIRSDRSSRAETVLSERYYLADADFVVGLTHDDDAVLEQLNQALRAPRWPLFLGRKSFVPSAAVPIGVVADDLLPAVAHEAPWRARPFQPKPPDRLRIMAETPFGQGPEVRQDVPLCFGYQRRKFATRNVETIFLPDEKRELRLPAVIEEDA